jgi:hypothetical protein
LKPDDDAPNSLPPVVRVQSPPTSIFARNFGSPPSLPPGGRNHAGAMTLAAAAGYAAIEVDPTWLRAVLLISTALLIYVMGLIQVWPPPPRRRR